MKDLIHAGQICEVEDRDPSDVFLITQSDIIASGDNDVEAVRLRDLQRNLSDPSAVIRVRIPFTSLKIIANDLEAYIESWNKDR
ncbi:hypothetical protein AAFN85_03535 [Mucilaginibacter sp. CAU 1740]|uniref:hypothetical protein n=1 Tax=Mucilaginibacter sp. CAU 1740 TaxID=3140365 RepID=UPI00325B0ADE